MRVLLTAFEAYDDWKENSSWLTLVEFLKNSPQHLDLVTRLYPVKLQSLRERLVDDLQDEFDVVLHLGQSPGSTAIKLESIAINVAGCVGEKGEELPALVQDGPLAFRTKLPVGEWASALKENEIPAVVSYHAGTFLCNATMYLTHYYSMDRDQPPQVGFVHLPLATEQVANTQPHSPSLPKSMMTKALTVLLEQL